MQTKADFTREELMEHDDVLFEACHPLERLRTVASLLHSYPEAPFGMDGHTTEGVANMIENAIGEVEYLIEIANTQWRRDREKSKVPEVLQTVNS